MSLGLNELKPQETPCNSSPQEIHGVSNVIILQKTDHHNGKAWHINGWVQDSGISIANAMEMHC